MNQQLKDIAGTFSTYIYMNNRKVVPSSATLTVYRPGSTEKIIDGVQMAIAPDGLLSYHLSAALNADLGEGYKAEIIYTVDGASYRAIRFYDVVRSVLEVVITDEDLCNELPQLRGLGYVVHGTAESGSSTTIVDNELARYPDDFFVGGLATNLTHGETREIVDFVASTGTITITEGTAYATGDKYVLKQSFALQIRRAFEKIEQKLKSAGKRPHLVLDAYDLREAHILFAVAEVCKGQAAVESDGAFWWDMWKDYEKQAEKAYGELNLKYDYGGDGVISEGEHGSRSKFTLRYPTLI